MSGTSLPDYAIGARLLVGGYGVVHRGVGPVGDEVFAVVIGGEVAASERFEPELKSATSLLDGFDHPHAVTTLVADRDPSGRLLAITEAVPEPEVLVSALRAGGRPPNAVAMALSRELCDALAAAHERGIVHGAVHPRSVFIGAGGRAALADFAPGRALAATAAADDLELMSAVRPYLAPEIDYGEGPSIAADVYGLGALLFELWAGRPPPGEIAGPAEVRRVIEQALRSDPVARFESAGELAGALSEAATGVGLLPAPPWQVSAWVREHVEARKRGAEAHLRAAGASEGGVRGMARIPDVAPRPRKSDLSLAAAAARARGRRAGAASRTPTPLADASNVLGATSASDVLGRLDAVLSTYDESRAEEADDAVGRAVEGEDAPRRVRPAELIGAVIALLAVVALAYALVSSARSDAAAAADGSAASARIVPPERRLLS